MNMKMEEKRKKAHTANLEVLHIPPSYVPFTIIVSFSLPTIVDKKWYEGCMENDENENEDVGGEVFFFFFLFFRKRSEEK